MAIYREYSLPLSATITIRKMETTKDINRIKVVLVEKKRTNKCNAYTRIFSARKTKCKCYE